MRKRNLPILALVLALSLVFAACGDDDAETTSTTAAETTTTAAEEMTTTTAGEETTTTAAETTTTTEAPAEPGVLRMAMNQEFEPIFHPVQASSAQRLTQNLVFNQLVGLDPTDPDAQDIMPDLAETWQVSPDAVVHTFNLAEGVTWHDGEPFTADDVIFTINWTLQNFEAFGTFVPQWTQIEGAQEVIDSGEGTASGAVALDDYTVELTLAAPNAEFLRRLADNENSIMPEHVLAEETAQTIRTSDFTLENPVGTGPYTVVSVQPDQYIEFAAYPDYFKGAPKIGTVFYLIVEEAAAYAQLEAGELDLYFKMDPAEADRLDAVDGLSVGSTKGVGIVRLDLRNESPLFDTPEERWGVAYAVDHLGIVDVLLQGWATPLWVNPGFMQYDDIVQPIPYDAEMARQSLEAGGFPFGETVRLMYPQEFAGYDEIFAVVAQQLEDAGMTVELMPLETTIWIDYLRFQRDEWDINVTTGGSELLSPDRSAVYFDCDYEGERGEWQTGYRNCELDELFVAAREVSDQAARDEIYRQIAEILYTDMPAVHLYAPDQLYAYSDALGGGFVVSPSDHYSVKNIETWEIGG